MGTSNKVNNSTQPKLWYLPKSVRSVHNRCDKSVYSLAITSKTSFAFDIIMRIDSIFHTREEFRSIFVEISEGTALYFMI